MRTPTGSKRYVAKGAQRSAWRRSRGEEGQTLTVELVLLLPVMLALTVGVLEFGWWVNAHMVTSNAAQQAARSAAVTGIADAQTIDQQIYATMKGGGLDTHAANYTGTIGGTPFGGTVSAQGSGTPACAYLPRSGYTPELVTVTVHYTYHRLFPFLATPMFLDIGGAIPTAIKATSTMPVEQEWHSCP